MSDEQPKQPVTISRDDLYAQVWEKPMMQLASQYGISGNGLAKICRKLAVPYPGRGYWARKAAGQKVSPVRLPDKAAGVPSQVRIAPTLPPATATPPSAGAGGQARRRARAHLGRHGAGEAAAPPSGHRGMDRGAPAPATGGTDRSVAAHVGRAGLLGDRAAAAPVPRRAVQGTGAAWLQGQDRRARRGLPRSGARAPRVRRQGEIPAGAPAADRRGKEVGLQHRPALEAGVTADRNAPVLDQDPPRRRTRSCMDRSARGP